MTKLLRRDAAAGNRRRADLRRQEFIKYQLPRRERRKELLRRMRVVKHYRHGRTRFSEKTAAALSADRFGISVSTVRNYYHICMKDGASGLMPRSTAPQSAYQRISCDVHRMIATIRVLTGWGPKRISVCMRKELGIKVSHTTVWKDFARYHLRTRTYHPRAKSNGIDYKRYSRNHPNSLWHIDFKTSQSLLLGLTVSIMVVVDDKSRYCVGWKVIVGHPCAKHVIDTLSGCIEKYGKPKAILTDNASVFVGGNAKQINSDKKSAFEQYLGNQSIELITTAPYYPQTNGKAEAFIRTMVAECLVLALKRQNRQCYGSAEDLEKTLAEYMEYYNYYRPHGSLGYDTPVHKYAGCRLISRGFEGTPALRHIDFGVEKRKDHPPDITPGYIACRLRYLDSSNDCQRSASVLRQAKLSYLC